MIQFKTRTLTIFESALFRTTSGLYTGNGALVLVDPTWLPDEVAAIRHYLDDLTGKQGLHLIFTHSDYDHIIGDGAFPEAKTVASRAFTESADKAEQVRLIREFDEKYYLDRHYPVGYPEIDFVIDEDEQFLAAGEARLSFWLAPGHNPDGILTLIEPDGILFAGDYLSDVEFPFVYHSFRAYRETLVKIDILVRSGRVRILIPGHGSVCTTTEEMQKRLSAAHAYLDTLEDCLLNNKPFPEQQLWSDYKYKAGQQEYHEKNIELFRREFGL